MDWALGKKIDIISGGDLYLRRWVLLLTPWFQVLLHKIYRPDQDRHVHNHPWWFRSFILKGGYKEEVPASSLRGAWDHYGIHKYRTTFAGSWTGVNLDSYHRIAELYDGPVWTLVFTGGKKQAWGFLVDGTWVHNQRYLGLAGTPELGDGW